MSNLERVEGIAGRLRQEPDYLLKNECIIKSMKLKRECEALGIPARVVACIGLAQARLFGQRLSIPVIHGWGEVEGKNIETSPLVLREYGASSP